MTEDSGCFYCDHHMHMATKNRGELKAPRLRFFSWCEAKRGESHNLIDQGGESMFVVFLNAGGRIIVGLESPAVAPLGTTAACFYTTR